MKLILIDPSNKSVSEVEWDGNHAGLAALLGCSLLDSVRLSGIECDCLFVDDEGLLTNPNPFGYFRINGYPGLLAGKALCVGIDGDGETTPPLMLTVANVRENVHFIDAGSMTEEQREPPAPEVITFDSMEELLAHLHDKRPRQWTPEQGEQVKALALELIAEGWRPSDPVKAGYCNDQPSMAVFAVSEAATRLGLPRGPAHPLCPSVSDVFEAVLIELRGKGICRDDVHNVAATVIAARK